jgi:hypothetical protein
VLAAPGKGVGGTSVYLLEVNDNLSSSLACPKFFAGPAPSDRASGVEAVQRGLNDRQHAKRRSPFFRVDVHLLMFADGPVLASTCSNPGCDSEHCALSSNASWGAWCQYLPNPETDVSCDQFKQLFPGSAGGDLLCGCARAAVTVMLAAQVETPESTSQPRLADRYYNFASEAVPFGVLSSACCPTCMVLLLDTQFSTLHPLIQASAVTSCAL